MKAAVLHERGAPLVIEDLDVAPPKAGEVLVKIVANGLCHSDLSVIRGVLPFPLPTVLGHEGAGIVEEVGAGVTLVKPGDRVVLSAVPYCGRCFHCTNSEFPQCDTVVTMLVRGTMADGTSRLSKGGTPIHAMVGLASMAEYAVVGEMACVRVPDDVRLEVACLVGCGVTTGVGAALNTAKVAPGSSAVVIGCGGVGLNVLQGSRIAGAATIVAVDLLDSKLEVAKRFGATHVVNAGRENVLKAVRGVTDGRGADYAFEVIGTGKTIELAYAVVRRRGLAVVVGASAREEQVTLPAASFLAEKTLRGSTYGSENPRAFMPRLIDLYRKKNLLLDELVSREFPLGEANQAMAALERGEVVRAVLRM